MKKSTFVLLGAISFMLNMMFKHLCWCTRIVKDTGLVLGDLYLVKALCFTETGHKIPFFFP